MMLSKTFGICVHICQNKDLNITFQQKILKVKKIISIVNIGDRFYNIERNKRTRVLNGAITKASPDIEL
jgi:hypothetical protein